MAKESFRPRLRLSAEIEVIREEIQTSTMEEDTRTPKECPSKEKESGRGGGDGR